MVPHFGAPADPLQPQIGQGNVILFNNFGVQAGVSRYNRQMTLQYDLHSHSTASDGSLTASELVLRARQAGVDVLALTDHDCLDGLLAARAAATPVGLKLVEGVEISVTWNGLTIHILGLAIDPNNPALQQGLSGLQAFRAWRAEEIGRRLARAGIANAYEGASALAQGRVVSRTHFAHFLVAQGRARSVQEVFKRFLVRNKPGYVPGDWASLQQALAWIRAAGGTAVVAHPARYRLTATKLRRLLTEFKTAGGQGIEVVSGSHTRDDVHHMAAVARSLALRASRGSDYHGPENPWVELGRLAELPSGCTPVWQDWSLDAHTQTQ